MNNESPNQHKVYRSDEIIDRILTSLGLQRTDSSEYKTYTVDGKLLRVRVSDHGVNLSSWYRNNKGEEIPLNDSDNIAFTFLPNKEECAERGEEFRTTAINKTTVYSDAATMTPIDFEFTVIHYIYQSWKFTEERLEVLVNKIVEYTNSGKFEDPLQNTSAKATVFNDTSNNKPKKINCNTNMNKKLIRLTESDLHKIVKESVQNIISEVSLAPNGYKHRFDLNKRDGDFPLEQPEWTKDPRWQGWKGEDPEWIMKQQKESGDPYYGNKQPVRVSEEQLHQIVKESVEQALSEGFFDKFRRTANARDAYKGLDGDYSYSKDNDRFYYHDKYGNKHDTGIGYGKGTVGKNWNPFSKHFWNGGDRQVTQSDANFAKMRLKHFNDGSWGGKSRQDIDYNGKRAYDNEQERKRQEAWREQQRREEENNQRYRAERPHRIGNTTDQYGHIRAYFDDDAAYDAGLR